MAFNNEGFGGAGQVKNSIDNAIIKIYGKKLENGTGAPSLAVKLVQTRADMQVRVDVYTNAANDKEKGLIRQDFSIYAFNWFLEQIEAALHGNAAAGIEPLKADQRFSLDVSDHVWTGGKRSDSPMLKNKLFFGRNPEGLYFISLVNYDSSRPKIQFFLELPNRMAFVKNGQPLKNEEASFISACSFVRTVRSGMTSRSPSVAFAPYDPNAKGGNGGGGGNRGGYSGGGNGGTADVDFDNDIAF